MSIRLFLLVSLCIIVSCKKEELPKISTNDISNITTNYATGGGIVTSDMGTAVTARGVCWSTSLNPTTSDNKTYDGEGTGAFTSSIGYLSPGTTYHVSAYATNSAGTGYGKPVSFTTLPFNAETDWNDCLNFEKRFFEVKGIDLSLHLTAYIGWRRDGCYYGANLQLRQNDSTGIYFYPFLDSIKVMWIEPFFSRDGFMELSLLDSGPYKISDSVNIKFKIIFPNNHYCNSIGYLKVGMKDFNSR